jgi:hypothetical protein
MSDYKEFKQDVKEWGVALILANVIIWIGKIVFTLLTLGIFYALNSKHKRNKINNNYYKI